MSAGLLPAVALGASGAVLVLASFAALMAARPPVRALLLTAAGCALIGGGLLVSGAWPGTALTWAVAAYLVVQWARLERKAGRK